MAKVSRGAAAWRGASVSHRREDLSRTRGRTDAEMRAHVYARVRWAGFEGGVAAAKWVIQPL